MLGRTNAGGGGSGCTLTVTGVAGDAVTITKDGKTKKGTCKDDGTVTFKGLKSGEWTVTMTGSGGTAINKVTINADYKLTMDYFSATITVTYPGESNCIVKNNDGETVASDSNTGTTAKEWTVTVNAEGDYTITATSITDETKSKDAKVSITAEGQAETVVLEYLLYIFRNGAFENGYSMQYSFGYSIKNGVIYSGSGSQTGNTYMSIAPAVDITNYSTLCALAYKSSSGGYTRKIGIRTSPLKATTLASQTFAASATVTNTSAESTDPTELDISAYNGEYYIASCSGIMYITEIYLK